MKKRNRAYGNCFLYKDLPAELERRTKKKKKKNDINTRGSLSFCVSFPHALSKAQIEKTTDDVVKSAALESLSIFCFAFLCNFFDLYSFTTFTNKTITPSHRSHTITPLSNHHTKIIPKSIELRNICETSFFFLVVLVKFCILKREQKIRAHVAHFTFDKYNIFLRVVHSFIVIHQRAIIR